MTAWTPEDLARIGDAEEIDIASLRPDGSLRSYVTIWIVRVDDALYVRSAFGSENPWFRRATAAGEGRVRAADLERDATFDAPDHALDASITAAFHEKYDRFGAELVDPVVSAESERATLRVMAR
jgi:hypothetical protein